MMDGEPMSVDRRSMAQCGPAVLLTAALALTAPWSVLGCSDDPSDRCTWSAQCSSDGETGVCEPTGYCSFYDGSCLTGRRYGAYSGLYAGACVEEFWPDGGAAGGVEDGGADDAEVPDGSA
jgi:hypothetical protein